MATYVNDLRLKEIATGDESGTWGTSTNTNLELIAEAFSFGTEAITTNADTHTTTIADGSTDPGRSIYLKYTGTLDSACTITIGPNTVSKLWFIENGTSGSQNIIISQGSGANVTVPPGDTKAIYSDGAGSGAAMVDAFASLNVVDLKVEDDLTVTDDLIVNGDIDLEGSIDVNGTANLDVVDIDGAVDMASTLAVGGVVTANAGVVVDNITIDGTEIDLSSGDLTIDVASETIIDSGSSGVLRLKHAGTDYGVFFQDSNNMFIQSNIADGDIIFRGNDGGSAGTVAFTLDMSEGGKAIFNAGATFDTNTLVVDASNNRVGIGENSPDNTLHVNSGTANIASKFESTDEEVRVQLKDSTGTAFIASRNDLRFGNDLSTERMRINVNGHVLIGTTSVQGVGGISFQEASTGYTIQQNMDGTSGGADLIVFRRNSAQIGSINQSSTNAVSYNTSSDARLKDVTGSARGLDVINNLNPVAYNWKADNHADEGLIAQEVEELVPNAVNQDEDGYYSMDYSKLVTHLVKGMQEQQEQIESLKSEIENLKEK